ncbi:hypothetical protein [Porphyromonas cangingivalis]|uniref:hypothetical protein n=1 Tax=Porphyromonas cangingivalis TaxID=36874 RepID=UPI00242DB5A8|nr:hypothetical protein [Porphyromonas cangingivalis]
MRHLLSILLILFVVTSCKSSDEPNGMLKQDAQISINVVSDTAPRAESDEEQPLSPLEVVKQADAIHITPYGADDDRDRGIADFQRDIDNVAIKMFGSDIIGDTPRTKGQLQKYFIGGKDVYFTTKHDKDTIGYIPNKVLQEAYTKVLAAYEAGNYEEVYRLFQKAYTAVPCTSKQYRELKAKGLH